MSHATVKNFVHRPNCIAYSTAVNNKHYNYSEGHSSISSMRRKLNNHLPEPYFVIFKYKCTRIVENEYLNEYCLFHKPKGYM